MFNFFPVAARAPLALVLALVLCGCATKTAAETLPCPPAPEQTRALEFQTVLKRFHGGETLAGVWWIPERKKWEVLLADNPRWRELDIDFERHDLIAAFLGERRTGGYNIHIDRIREDEQAIYVYVKARSPASGEAVTMGFTAPLHIVQIPSASGKKVLLVDGGGKHCAPLR